MHPRAKSENPVASLSTTQPAGNWLSESSCDDSDRTLVARADGEGGGGVTTTGGLPHWIASGTGAPCAAATVPTASQVGPLTQATPESPHWDPAGMPTGTGVNERHTPFVDWAITWRSATVDGVK